jgi:hypothetical protein
MITPLETVFSFVCIIPLYTFFLVFGYNYFKNEKKFDSCQGVNEYILLLKLEGKSGEDGIEMLYRQNTIKYVRKEMFVMSRLNLGAYIGTGNGSGGFSPEEQKQKLETWARENNASISGYYIDNERDESRSLKEHKEFKRLINDIDMHKIDGVLSIDYGRLTTDRDDLNKALGELQVKGIEVFSITDVVRGK